MLVECIRWALPQPEAMAAALGIAHMSGDLVGSKLSHRTLQGVLRLVSFVDLLEAMSPEEVMNFW